MLADVGQSKMSSECSLHFVKYKGAKNFVKLFQSWKTPFMYQLNKFV